MGRALGWPCDRARARARPRASTWASRSGDGQWRWYRHGGSVRLGAAAADCTADVGFAAWSFAVADWPGDVRAVGARARAFCAATAPAAAAATVAVAAVT
mmetsp:Transcript_64783/g.163098  ORF Transcript_64783/g.163098 Transcript_64783/m.163098 type:complete len:100 (+) Transcript_64783:1510-1809(+)